MVAVMPSKRTRHAPKMNLKTGSTAWVVVMKEGFTFYLPVQNVKKSEADENCQHGKGEKEQPAQEPSLVLHMHEKGDDQPRLDDRDGQRAPYMTDPQVVAGY